MEHEPQYNKYSPKRFPILCVRSMDINIIAPTIDGMYRDTYPRVMLPNLATNWVEVTM